MTFWEASLAFPLGLAVAFLAFLRTAIFLPSISALSCPRKRASSNHDRLDSFAISQRQWLLDRPLARAMTRMVAHLYIVCALVPGAYSLGSTQMLITADLAYLATNSRARRSAGAISPGPRTSSPQPPHRRGGGGSRRSPRVRAG